MNSAENLTYVEGEKRQDSKGLGLGKKSVLMRACEMCECVCADKTRGQHRVRVGIER